MIIAAKQTLQHADVHQAGQDADFLFVRKKKGSETLSFSFPTECLLWVISRHFETTLRMSIIGGIADVFQGVAECPLIAISGHGDADGYRRVIC